MEAANISYHISETARYSGLDTADIRRLLLSMVDPESQKTTPAQEQQLLRILPAAKRDEEKLANVLENLTAKEIIRKRIDPDTRASVWLLDHDYLSRGVLELERRASYWAGLLADAERAFRAARPPWEKWQALLGPWVQVRLWFERIRGRITYGKARGVALASVVRLAVNLPVLLVLLGLYGLTYVRTLEEANRLSSEIGVDLEMFQMGESEAKALWELNASEYKIKRAVLLKAISETGAAERFYQRGDLLLHAIVGFDPSTRARLVRDVLPHCYPMLSLDWTPTQRVCVWLTVNLDPDPSRVVQWVVRALESTGGLQYLGFGLEEFAGRLNQHDASLVLSAWLRGMSRRLTSELSFPTLRILAARINPANAQAAVSSLLELITGGYRGDALAILTPKLNESELHEIFPRMLKAMQSGSAEKRLVADALRAGPRLAESDAQAAFTEVLNATIEANEPTKRTDPRAFSDLSKALWNTAAKLSESNAHAAFSQLSEAQRHSDGAKRYVMTRALGAISGLQQSDAWLAFTELLKVIKVNRDETHAKAPAIAGQIRGPRPAVFVDCDEGLGPSLAAVARQIKAPSAQLAFAQMLQAVRTTSDGLILCTLLEGLAAFPQELNGSNTKVAISHVLDIISRANIGVSLALVQKLAALPTLARPDAKAAFFYLLKVRYTFGDEKVPLLQELYTDLASKLNEQDIHEAFSQISLEATSGPDVVRSLEEKLVPLAVKLNKSDAESASAQLLKAMKRTAFPGESPSLAVAYAATIRTVGPQERVFGALWESMANFSEPPCQAFGQVVTAENLPHVVEILKWPTCSQAERAELIEKIGQFREVSLGTEIGGQFVADRWSFAEWAQKQGFNLGSPPQRYPLTESKVSFRDTN